jgi:hypothetical protein
MLLSKGKIREHNREAGLAFYEHLVMENQDKHMH